jgi:hypothetical protein
MGGLWVDYELMSNIRALRSRRGQFSDHGANRLGASALMQGSGWLASSLLSGFFLVIHKMNSETHAEFRQLRVRSA